MGVQQNINSTQKKNSLANTENKNTIHNLIKNSRCKINIDNKLGTGFICIINNYGNSIPVLITQEFLIDKNNLNKGSNIILESNEKSIIISIDDKRRIYTDNKNNISIIELYSNELNKNDYLEIDSDNDNNYENKTVYILFPDNEEIIYYIDKIMKVDCNILYLLAKNNFLSKSLILDLETNKVIGYYSNKELNSGILINQKIVDEFNKSGHVNEILLKIKVTNYDLYQRVYFLCDKNGLEEGSYYLFYYEKNKNLKDVQKEIKNNTTTYINGRKSLAPNFFIPKKEGIYPIRIVFHKKVKYCCFLFGNCSNIIEINISNFDISNVVNMCGMFYGCKYLENIHNISFQNIPDKVIDLSYMFDNCSLLKKIPDISHWNTSKVEKMEYMFTNCTSLLVLPDISKWDVSKVKDMKYMFSNCKLLSYLPDISKWNISNLKQVTYMFQRCSSLTYFPDISKWNTSKLYDTNNLFYGCYSLSFLPNIKISDGIVGDYKTTCFSLLLPNN